MPDYRRNHYVPEWYQHRFFSGKEKEKKFYYLDLTPETRIAPNGKKYSRHALLNWGPNSCFVEEDLYTTKYLGWESTEIEKRFFGKIDAEGQKAVEYFSQFEHPDVNNEAFQTFLVYMSVQKLRTPKGLQYLSALTGRSGKNEILIEMQKIQQMHCALWTECVWSIVDATNSPTKFILSDHPITVYNQDCFPGSKWCKNGRDPHIWFTGTHTVFPLCLEKALVLTNLSWVRDPYGDPLKNRPHPDLFRDTIFNFTKIQTGRMLSEVEVVTINYIIKNRALRYIASPEKEWLYPEKKLAFKRWDKIGSSYLLMPDPRSLTFSTEVIIGHKNRRADFFDEYGRKPWHPDYNHKTLNEYEWNSFHAFQGEFARLFGPKRRGSSNDFGHVVTEDDLGYHAYHLKLESQCKAKIFTKSKHKKKRKKRR